MENCKYNNILMDFGGDTNGYDKSTWKPLMRQCLIASGVCCVYFLHGLFLGAPTVLVAQIRSDVNSADIITDEMLSWISTTMVISSAPFVVILPLLFKRIGRKLTFIFIWLLTIIGFIILYDSTNLYHILLSEVFAGASSASTITIAPVIIAEYTSPQYRGVFLYLNLSTAFWGIWTSNAIGTFFHWKNIAIVALVCSVSIITVMAWPESPYWLAKRGRYAESAKAHRWLKGVNEHSEKELAQLIISHKNFINASLHSGRDNYSVCKFHKLSRKWSIIMSRPFYKPALISIILLALYNFTGKSIISMYAIEVLKNLTNDQSFVYTEMIILDGVTVFSMYISCIISRYFRRRTLLLLFTGVGILLLYTLSVYLYLASLSIILKNDIVILLILSVFSIASCCGPITLSLAIYGEIIPPRYQHIAMILVGLSGVTIMSTLLKSSPFLFNYFEMHGTFLFFAITSTIILIILYVHLPETKDKTIQEIETLFSETTVLEEERKTYMKIANK